MPLAHGWCLYSNSTILADWLADSSDRWIVPVGFGVGKVLKIGRQSASIALQVVSNVERPDFPKWEVNLQFALLFP